MNAWCLLSSKELDGYLVNDWRPLTMHIRYTNIAFFVSAPAAATTTATRPYISTVAIVKREVVSHTSRGSLAVLKEVTVVTLVDGFRMHIYHDDDDCFNCFQQ